jgi:PKD repeat protein
MVYKKTNWLFFVMLFGASVLPSMTQAAPTPLVEWTFPNSSDNSIADGGTPENISKNITLVGGGIPTFATSGATTSSARATGWQSGQLQKYWQLEVDTRDYHNVTLSSKQRSSSTGPRDFVVEYRIGTDGAWTAIPGGIVTLADNFTTGTLDTIPLPSECANQQMVFIRFLMSTNISVSGSTVTSTGASRIDDIIISAELIDEPEDDSNPTPTCLTTSPLIKFSEIFPYAPTADAEYVELLNSDTECVDLSSWRIEDANNHKYVIPGGTLVAPNQLLVFFRNFYMNNTSPETLYLYNAANEVVDSLSYDRAIKGFSYSFDGDLFRFTSLITPGTTNTFDENETPEEDPDTTETSSEVYLNELLANPKGDEVDGEYIELFNNGATPINLKGWGLLDASQKKFILTQDTSIESLAYLVLPRSLFKFSLNNFGTETVSIVDPTGKEIDTVTYTNPKEGLSYSRKKDSWHFTKHQTPGEDNEFSKEPKITIKSKRDGLVKTPLLFEAQLKRKAGAKKLSYRWDFGDGHGSNLESPKHTYQKKGTYDVTVRIKNDSTDVTKAFTVTVRNYPKLPILITALKPNPEGKDTDLEWLELKNTSQKSVDLQHWKIATGDAKDDLTNHPIRESLTLAPKETRRITRAESAFSLNNKKSLIELRSPDDETVSSASYDEEKIEDDAICRNIKEVCDFPDAPKKSDEEDTSDKSGEVLGVTTIPPQETPTDTGENQVTSTATLTDKQEIIHRIGKDINTLLNLYIQEWTTRP